MKNYSIQISLIFALVTLFASCDSKKVNKEKVKQPISYTYETSLSLMPGTKAPALQSFAHGSIGTEWILLAGALVPGISDRLVS